METNIREVSFSNSYTEHLYGFAQYDRGQKIKITGIETDANTEVHFSLSASGGESPRVLPDSTGAETIVSVPDFVFCADRMYDYEAYAFVCYSDVNVGKTERRIIMHIKSRPKPADFAPPSDPDLTQKVLQELGTKLTAPSSAQIGQIFRVQSITEDGNLVLEAVDMPSGGSGGAVDDVQINGTSIVGEDGVAEIPLSDGNTYGVTKPAASNYGLVTNQLNEIILLHATNDYISNRTTYSRNPITPTNLDYAVKCAMCDGKGEAWTADEQAMARARIGIGRYEILNLTLDERLEGSMNAKFFTTSVTSDGIELSSLNIRRLLYRIKYPSSDEYTGGNMLVAFNDMTDQCGTIYIASDSVVCGEIEVVDRYNIYFPTPQAPAKSFNSVNYQLSGAYLYDNCDKLGNDRNQIESIQFYANYPKGTVLPAGTEITIIGIAY